MRAGVAGCAIFLLVFTVGIGESLAESCGGTIACRCGDAVVADYLMTGDLGPCAGHGLVIRSSVTLDCQGFRLEGIGDGSEQYGAYLNGNTGAEVKGARVTHCDISGFARGVRLRSAEGNAIVDNLIHHNGDPSTQAGYGIDLSAGATGNLLQGNAIHDNYDEGIHFGSGSGGNQFIGNLVFDNFREQIYLLASHGNRLIGNTSYGTGSNSLYLKDSSDTHLESNTFRDRTARVTGDATRNTFLNNSFVNATLQLRVYEATPNRIPTGNRVDGGSMTSTSTCLRFTSSSGNTISDVALGGCGTEVMSEGTAAEPSVNAIIGTALNPSKVSTDGSSTLSVGWWLDARVEDSAGRPVAGARVQALDALGGPVFDLPTGPTGVLARQTLWQYVRVGGLATSRTPHVLTTSSGGSTDVRVLHAVEDLDVAIKLSGVTPPGGGGPEPPPPNPGGNFTDAFDRPNSTVLGRGWVEVIGDLLLSGGELRNDATKTGPHMAVLPPVSDASYSVAADFASTDNNTAPRFGIVLGFIDPQNYYVLYRLVGGTSVLRIAKVVAGEERVLASTPVANPVRGALFSLRGVVMGSALSLELNGVPKLSVTNTGFVPGRPGVLIGVGVGRASHRVDNVSVSVP
jgi:parallel beta-helix repeat protein